MDPELATLSSVAATTLVTLMTTDSWERAKVAFVGLWRHRHPRQAEAVDADLTAAQLDVVAAHQAGDEQGELEVLDEWRSRLKRLVVSDDQLQDELQKLVEKFRPMLPAIDYTRPVVMRARASGLSRINQAGRDQTIIGK